MIGGDMSPPRIAAVRRSPADRSDVSLSLGEVLALRV